MLARLGGGISGSGGSGGGGGVRPLAAALAAAAAELDPRPPWSLSAARRALTELHASVMVADGALDGEERGGGGGGGAAAGIGVGRALAAGRGDHYHHPISSSTAYDAGACRSWLASAQAFVLAVQRLLLQQSSGSSSGSGGGGGSGGGNGNGNGPATITTTTTTVATNTTTSFLATPDAAELEAAAGDLRRAAAALATADSGVSALATFTITGPMSSLEFATFVRNDGGAGGKGSGVWPQASMALPAPSPRQRRRAATAPEPPVVGKSGARYLAQRPAAPYQWYARKPAL
jgi:hypothetical protein